MVAVHMAQKAGERRAMPWLVAEVVDADLGKLVHDAFEGRHGSMWAFAPHLASHARPPRLRLPSPCRSDLTGPLQ